MNPSQVYMCSPSWTLLPPPSPDHPSGSSQCTSPKRPVSGIEPGLASHFIHDIIHVSMPFSQIIPPLPFPTESKRLFYTSVSLLLSHIQGWRRKWQPTPVFLAWGIPGMGEPDGLPSVGLHRVGHNWSNLAAAAEAYISEPKLTIFLNSIYMR